MSKAFVKDDAGAPETDEVAAPLPPPAGKNYITPAGFARPQREKKQLLDLHRPEVVKTVARAASLGDRSENADYIYGKRRPPASHRPGHPPPPPPPAPPGRAP